VVFKKQLYGSFAPFQKIGLTYQALF